MSKKYKFSKEMDMGVFYIEQDINDIVEWIHEAKPPLSQITDVLMKISDKLGVLQNDGGNTVDEVGVIERKTDQSSNRQEREEELKRAGRTRMRVQIP